MWDNGLSPKLESFDSVLLPVDETVKYARQ